MRFVQFADVHLDSSIGGSLSLPADKRAALQIDIRQALARACALVSETRADMVLVPGDLFDYETVQAETAAFASDLFRSISPTPVFITPGNHDSLRPGGPYSQSGSTNWSDNVHIFTSPTFETITLSELDCTVTGIAHAHRGITTRMLAEPISVPRRSINLLLFHGSRDGFKPSEKENTLPFSDAEVIAQGFTYSAIGHYHSYAQITDEAGRVKAAYSGCVQGRGLDETGEKCVIVGEIDSDGRVILQRREVAARRIIGIGLDVTGLTDNDALGRKFDAMLAASGARDCDAVYVDLAGSAASTLDIDKFATNPPDDYFHVHINSGSVVPDYDLDALAAESAAASLKSAFVRRMLDIRDSAESENEKQIARDAIYYGLYALDGRKLEPRDAD